MIVYKSNLKIKTRQTQKLNSPFDYWIKLG